MKLKSIDKTENEQSVVMQHITAAGIIASTYAIPLLSWENEKTTIRHYSDPYACLALGHNSDYHFEFN